MPQVVIVSSLGPQGPTGPQGPIGPTGSFDNVTGSFVTTASFNAFTGSYNTGSFSGSFVGSGAGLFNIPASGITGLNLSQIASGSATASISPSNGFVVNTSASITGSLNLTGALTASSAVISGNVTVLGTASINTLVVNQTQLSTGSNQLGDAANDFQTLYGTVRIPTGSFTVSGSALVSGSITTTSDANFNGVSVGEGGGNISSNTRIGANALAANTTGCSNVAVGALALRKNTIGIRNTAIGTQALYNNTTGNSNVAVGYNSLYTNTTGRSNTAVGYRTLYLNTIGPVSYTHLTLPTKRIV